MSYTIALHFEDGLTRFIECENGETVLDAAYRHEINLPMDCADGVCGTCKGLCESGEYDLGDEYLEEALSEGEAAQRRVLTCQMVPSSDCVVQMPVTAELCKTGAIEYRASVVGVERLSESTFELHVRLREDGKPLAFLPGQYVNIRVPGSEQVRSYSFSTASSDPMLGFLIRDMPAGLMSRYLTEQAAPGDALTLVGPMGAFYLREVNRPLLFLAGGTGLAPFLAMLETIARAGLEQRIHMVYGVTRDTDLVKVDALLSYAERIRGFSYVTVVGDAASEHPRKGYVTHHLTDEALNGGDVDVYLCGPPPMVEAVRWHLAERRVEVAHLYYEKFASSASSGRGEVA